MPGPIEVRQIAGMLARRIVCHAAVDQHLPIGERFGLIKFGSRTELIIPRRDQTEILVRVGDKVWAGLSLLARQPVEASGKVGKTRIGRPQTLSHEPAS
jgi:phosphatidylserine decarboxylase